MAPRYYSVGDPQHKLRVGKRLLVVLANSDSGREQWVQILQEMLARTPRGEVYRAKAWSKNGDEPTEVLDTVCRELLTELEQHEQIPLFSSALVQELGGRRR